MLQDGLSLVLVKTGDRYTADYVNRMVSMVTRHVHLPMNYFCFTDNPNGIRKDVEIKMVDQYFPGWWNKLYCFSPHAPRGLILYMDLDQIILDDITPALTGLKTQFACYADHITWHGSKLGSAMMIFKPSDYFHIWDKFSDEYKMVLHTPGGDQAYVSQFIPEEEIDYINERIPSFAASYKYDLLEKAQDPLKFKLVNFHGLPKPADITPRPPWIQEHWK